VADELLDLFLSSTEDYAIILRDEHGRVLRWNRGAERLFGYTPAEVLGPPADAIFVASDRAAGVPQAELRSATDHGRAEDERWHLRKDGSRFWPPG
jgi:two-component system CheB/CheR fusion protein